MALFTAGLGTLVFHLVTGRMVPVFLGSSFAFIAPILAAEEAGFSLSAIGGGLVAAGLVYGLFALLVLLIGSTAPFWGTGSPPAWRASWGAPPTPPTRRTPGS